MFPILKWPFGSIWVCFNGISNFQTSPYDWHTASRLSIAKCLQKCLRTKSSSSSNSTWLDRSSGCDLRCELRYVAMHWKSRDAISKLNESHCLASTTLQSGLISLKMHSSELLDVQKSSEVWSQPILPVLRRLLPMGEFSSSAWQDWWQLQTCRPNKKHQFHPTKRLKVVPIKLCSNCRYVALNMSLLNETWSSMKCKSTTPAWMTGIGLTRFDPKTSYF